MVPKSFVRDIFICFIISNVLLSQLSKAKSELKAEFQAKLIACHGVAPELLVESSFY